MKICRMCEMPSKWYHSGIRNAYCSLKHEVWGERRSFLAVGIFSMILGLVAAYLFWQIYLSDDSLIQTFPPGFGFAVWAYLTLIFLSFFLSAYGFSVQSNYNYSTERKTQIIQ